VTHSAILNKVHSTVIKLDHSVIIFPEKWRSGNRLSGKMTIRESYYPGNDYTVLQVTSVYHLTVTAGDSISSIIICCW